MIYFVKPEAKQQPLLFSTMAPDHQETVKPLMCVTSWHVVRVQSMWVFCPSFSSLL